MPAFQAMDIDASNLLNHPVVDSSTDQKQYLQLDNHNAMTHSPCETCVTNTDQVTQSVRSGDEMLSKSVDYDMSNGSEDDNSVILIDDDVDRDIDTEEGDKYLNKLVHNQRYSHCDGLMAGDSAISSTTSPDRDYLLKAAGLVTGSVQSQPGPGKKRLSTKNLDSMWHMQNFVLIQVRSI